MLIGHFLHSSWMWGPLKLFQTSLKLCKLVENFSKCVYDSVRRFATYIHDPSIIFDARTNTCFRVSLHSLFSFLFSLFIPSVFSFLLFLYILYFFIYFFSQASFISWTSESILWCKFVRKCLPLYLIIATPPVNPIISQINKRNLNSKKWSEDLYFFFFFFLNWGL